MITEFIHTADIPTMVYAAGSITDAANSLTDTVTSTIIKLGSGIAAGFFAYRVVKSRFSVPSMLMAGVAAALFLWLILGGYTWIQDRIKGQVDTTAASVIRVVDTPTPLTLDL